MQRFWSKVKILGLDDCWEWQAATDKDGYGKFSIKENDRHIMKLAHRVSYILTHGQITSDQCVCHTCDNPPCVNPSHQFIGSKLENNKDRDVKNRLAKGIQNGKAVLTEADVVLLRTLYRAGSHTYLQLADMYGMTKSGVYEAITYKTWKHVA